MEKLPVVFVVFGCVFGTYGFSSSFLSDEAEMLVNEGPKCGQCNVSACFKLQYCVAVVVKDHCGCCNVCSTDLYQANVRQDRPVRKESPCSSVSCPKYKVCMENMQGLPLCTCASIYSCSRKKKEVCGIDGITYHSRCHMRIAACKLGKRLKVRHKDACTAEEIAAGAQGLPHKKRKNRRKSKRRRRKKAKNDKLAVRLDDMEGRQRDSAEPVGKRGKIKRKRRRHKRRQRNNRRKGRQYKSRRISRKYKLLPYRF